MGADLAITLHQPWAGLVFLRPTGDQEADPVKRYETRGCPPWTIGDHRPMPGCRLQPGSIVAIHAGMDFHTGGWPRPLLAATDALTPGGMGGYPKNLPRGAIVGAAMIVRALQVVRSPVADRDARQLHLAGARLFDATTVGYTVHAADCRDISDQLPFGDFSEHRWGWELADAWPCEVRCPRCWGSGCATCQGVGSCPPIPMTGRQGVWKITWPEPSAA